jgi:hypothetical protein
MQALLTEAVTIPSLLHETDALFKDQSKPQSFKTAAIFRSLIGILKRLANWQERLSLASDQPCHWAYAVEAGNFQNVLWMSLFHFRMSL